MALIPKANLFSARTYDAIPELVYMGARYYSPQFSIFTSPDPMHAYRSWISPYNYAQNNPVMRQDPTGMLDGGVLEDGNPGGPTLTKRLPAPALNIPNPKLDRSPFPDLVVPIRETLLDDVDVQPIGESTWLKDVFYHTLAFGMGLANAIGSNGLFGLGRRDPSELGRLSNSARSGQITGDFLSLLIGSGEVLLGGLVAFGGGFISISGFGAVLGLPAAAFGGGVALHGLSTLGVAFKTYQEV